MPKIKISEKRIADLERRARARTGVFEPAVFGICDLEGNVLRCKHYGGAEVDRYPEKGPIQIDTFIPEKLEKLLLPRREKHIYGGRGSAKTRTVASIYMEAIRFNNIRGVVFREFLENIRSSCYQEIVDEVNRRSLNGTQMKVTERYIASMIGEGFTRFKGMHNNTNGIKGEASAQLAWLEEIENMSLISWDTLEPTFRVEGSEIWSTFNPRSEHDPAWTELIEPYHAKLVDGIYDSADDPDYDSSLGDVLIIECNHVDNPWFTKELERSMLKMKARDYDRYLWIWEGKFNKKSNEQVMHGKWHEEEFVPESHWDGPFFGADFGFAQDPSSLVKLWIDLDAEILYVEYEAVGVGVELDDMAKFYAGKEGATEDELEGWDDGDDYDWPGIPGAKDDQIWGDCSRPETISHIRKKDFYIDAAEKWPGSIEDGITFLRSFKKIVIHPRCTETLKEAELYKHKVDKLTENILPIIVDAHNHCWDAIRYALHKQIRSIQSFFDV